MSIKQNLIDTTRENYKQYLTEDVEKTTLGDLFDDVLQTEVKEEPKKKTKKVKEKVEAKEE